MGAYYIGGRGCEYAVTYCLTFTAIFMGSPRGFQDSSGRKQVWQEHYRAVKIIYDL